MGLKRWPGEKEGKSDKQVDEEEALPHVRKYHTDRALVSHYSDVINVFILYCLKNVMAWRERQGE